MNDLLVRHGDQIDAKQSSESIDKFLRQHPAAIGNLNGIGYQRDAQGNFLTNDYVKHAVEGYKLYSAPQNYAQDRAHLEGKHYI